MSHYLDPRTILGHIREFVRTTSEAAVAVFYDAPWRRAERAPPGK